MRDKHAILRARAMRKEPTRSEKILWDRLRAHRLNGWGFRRQPVIGSFVVDFACLSLKLVVEVDGPVHDEPEQIAFDTERQKTIEAAGYLMIRVKERVVRDATDHVVDWISAVGGMILTGEVVPESLRTMTTVPLP